MAVPEQTPYIEHTGNGITTSFALGFQCETKDHLIVLIDDIEPPIATWSLTGGNVIFTTAPAAGKKITLQRNTPFSRTTDYQSYNNSFRPPAVNKDFDWIWWKLQELGVADWILGNRISALKNYVDRKDDELKAYLMEEIRKQGVALDQLDEYYNYLMERLAQIAVDKGWDASFVVDASGKTQQEINDSIGSEWYSRNLGYSENDRASVDGDVYQSLENGNTSDPSADISKWALASKLSFSSIEQLRKYNPNVPNSKVHLRGLEEGSQLGAGDWYYDATDTTSTDNGWFIVVTNNGKRLKRVDLENEINIKWAGLSRNSDLATVLQQANDYIVAKATSLNILGGLPVVLLPAQTYKLSKTVTLSTVTRVVPIGTVVIDCTDWTDLSKGAQPIRILNTFTRLQGRPGSTQNSAVLGAGTGTITLIGAGRDTAAVTGVWVGNLAAGFVPTRGNIMTGVSIVNFNKGVEWGRYNIYLQRYNDCHFEGNKYNLYCSNAAQTDSGERNSFTNCVFGVAGINHVYHNQPALDINFEDCSFDYCGDSIIYTGSQASFSTLKFTDCHFEDYANYLLDGESASYRSVVFNNPIFLKTGTPPNSVSKPLFSPNILSAIVVNGYEMRTTVQAWDRNIFVTGPLNSVNNRNITMKGCFRDAWGHIPSLRNIKNKSYDFSGETVGADGTTVPFVNFTVTVKGNTNITIDSNKRLSLQKTATANAYCTLVSNSIPVDCLSQYGIIPSFIRGASRGGKISCIIDYYDSTSALLGSSTNFQVSLDTYWTNANAPNIAKGDTRDICLQMQSLSTPPPFAVSAKMRFIISEYTETLLMTSMMFIEFPT